MKVICLSLLWFGIFVQFCYVLTSTPCALRQTKYGSVCVCNVDHCDYLEPAVLDGNDGFVLTSTSKMGLRFFQQRGSFSDETFQVRDYETDVITEDEPVVLLLDKRMPETGPNPRAWRAAKRKVTIKVNRSKKYQKIVGFGGAFTGTVSYLLENLPQELQDAVYKSYYSKEGLDFNLLRMTIGGSDFDLAPWAYNEFPENDVNLSNFTKLSDLDEIKVDQLNRLKAVANIDGIKILATAWSSPKWMKTNKNWTGFGFLIKKFYQTWADYHLKFLELMAAKNLPIWAISTGNEPLNGVIAWVFIHFMSLGWTPKSQAEWLTNNLGPTIRNSQFKDVKILSNDDQRYTFPAWFKKMNQSRPESMNYLDGFAVHWYWDQFFSTTLVEETQRLFPDKILLSTESCAGAAPLMKQGPLLGSWERAEIYAHSYLDDLQHSFNGYIDWNLILDEQGGPNYVKNFVDAAIIVNMTSGQEIYKQPMFYTIGHFSKFIPEGSIRIEASTSNINIVTAAFERPDRSICVVFFNSAQVEVDVTLVDSIRGNVLITIPPKSIHTIEYN